jgi:hypothetical protein
MTTVYKIRTTVKELMFKKRVAKVTADRRDPAHPIINWEYEDVGWFVQFHGSYEALFVGKDRPDELEEGQKVEITIKAVK